MRTVTIARHRVADYDAWKRVYDGAADMQRAGGVREHAVLRDRDDPSLITVVHTFDDEAAADAFFGSEDLRAAMADAGVYLDSLRLEVAAEVVAGRL